jgi:RNA polymerase sigma-70 factor (ECF subfamily)
MHTDEERFTALYERYYGDIERYVRRRAADVTARDVVAEVFTIVWRRPDQIPAGDALPWLYGVARRVLANEVRGTLRARSLQQRVGEHAVGVVGDHAEEVASRLATTAAFDTLGEADREVLRLVGWEGLSARDAAKALGCSLPALAMRLHRARARFRAALHDGTTGLAISPFKNPPLQIAEQKGRRS